MYYTFYNKLHNTEVRQYISNEILLDIQYQTIMKKLCGLLCTCGNAIVVMDDFGNFYEMERLNILEDYRIVRR